MRYEIGLNIRKGDIVWVNGGVPCGSWPDLKLARSQYCNEVDPGEKTIADRGYRDNNYFINPQDNQSGRRLQSRIRARHETVNSRIKSFKVTSSPFRHDTKDHLPCFFAVANICQLNILFGGEELFPINI